MWQAEEDGRTGLLKSEASAGVITGTGGVLQEYATEFLRLRSAATSRIQVLQEASAKGETVSREDFKAAEKAVSEMESNRRQVQASLRCELSGATGSTRQEWDQRVKDWSAEVKRLSDQLDLMQEANDRRSLGLEGGSSSSTGANERLAAMQSTELLDRGLSKLEEVKRQSFETESISAQVLSDLSSQRETILNTRSNMSTIGSELSSARKTLDRMFQFAQSNQRQTVIIAAVLALGLTFWLLCILGLPLKTTLLLAVAVVLLGAGVIFVRRRSSARSLPLG
eukprot:TRINITY_DN21285_c0_g1_i1.p1 TRINITY_DN21285_c0_g1~~TRINITY_DN21285_c0_g1_i1.p1  ORF type:complete len:282 (-),score=53.74 TRINITY_DN21285_c0_g1_i1:118-963(-)